MGLPVLIRARACFLFLVSVVGGRLLNLVDLEDSVHGVGELGEGDDFCARLGIVHEVEGGVELVSVKLHSWLGVLFGCLGSCLFFDLGDLLLLLAANVDLETEDVVGGGSCEGFFLGCSLARVFGRKELECGGVQDDLLVLAVRCNILTSDELDAILGAHGELLVESGADLVPALLGEEGSKDDLELENVGLGQGGDITEVLGILSTLLSIRFGWHVL